MLHRNVPISNHSIDSSKYYSKSTWNNILNCLLSDLILAHSDAAFYEVHVYYAEIKTCSLNYKEVNLRHTYFHNELFTFLNWSCVRSQCKEQQPIDSDQKTLTNVFLNLLVYTHFIYTTCS